MKTIETIIFFLLLIDSVSSNIISWGGEEKWYAKRFRVISKNFPATKGWTTYYLILVLWMGVMLFIGHA